MRPFTPMTMIVVLALAACLIAGLVIVWMSARSSGSAKENLACPRCGTGNRAKARFCAQCGAKIESQGSRSS